MTKRKEEEKHLERIERARALQHTLGRLARQCERAVCQCAVQGRCKDESRRECVWSNNPTWFTPL